MMSTSTLVGGLGAGLAICAAVLLILLFRHRRASKNGPTNLLAGDAEKKSLLAERQSLLAQLSEAQAERTQLRTHLQVSDTQDPRDVVEAFDRLNVSIRKACLLASRSLLKSAQSKALRTTKDASNLNQLQRDLVGVPTLVLSEKGAGRKLEDFLSEALRFIVNAALVSKLFDTFHPDISPEENKLLLEMYRGIRRSGVCQIHPHRRPRS